jgi:hypothetical protein
MSGSKRKKQRKQRQSEQRSQQPRAEQHNPIPTQVEGSNHGPTTPAQQQPQPGAVVEDLSQQRRISLVPVSPRRLFRQLPKWVKRAVYWLLFTGLAGLAPLLAGALAGVTFKLRPVATSGVATLHETPISEVSLWSGLLGGGELLIISAVIGIDALGEVLTSEEPRTFITVLLGWIISLLAVGASVWFAIIYITHRPQLEDRVERNTDTIVTGSIVVYFVTLLVGILCVIAACEGRQKDRQQEIRPTGD